MRAATLIVLALLVPLAACGPRKAAAPAPAAASAGPAAIRREAQRITGTVTARNAARFAEMVAGQEDQIIGLKIGVAPSTDADFKASRYLVGADSEPFSISIGDGGGEGDGTEVVLPLKEAPYLHGLYVIDGFYQVKPGGMHQGITSYGLEKVDPASVLLNGAVTVTDKALP